MALNINELKIGTIVECLKTGKRYKVWEVNLEINSFLIKYSKKTRVFHPVYKNEFSDYKIVLRPEEFKQVILTMTKKQFRNYFNYMRNIGVISITDRVEEKRNGKYSHLSVGDEIEKIEIKDVKIYDWY